MTRTEEAVGGGSKRVKGVRRARVAGARYARYTEEQMEVLENFFAMCSTPNHFQRQQLLSDQPILRGIDNKQLKVWFQNHRFRGKQRRENVDLASENRRLIKAYKKLKAEKDDLQKQLTELICENEDLRNQVLNMQLTFTVTTHDLVPQSDDANNPELPVRIADNKGLLSLAEETKKEFVSKAIGTAINWIPAPWLKIHTPGTIYVSTTSNGVAARACVTISLEPFKAIEILKDRASWSRRCRNMDVVAKYPAVNGGTIEIIYTKYYAPTIVACARDFWTLRYTSPLEDGSFVVCEKSISGSDAGSSSPVALEFVRGKMLASGYLIRPCEGGSTIYLVDHFDLEASSVPEVVRPLYESSEIVAKKTIVSALHYIEQVANETNGKQKHASREDPTFARSFSQRLSRGFNDALSCFSEDGWTLMNLDATDDVVMSIKQFGKFGVFANFDSLICVKASVLLQNVFPATIVKLLKERRSAWMNFNFINHSEVYSKAASFAYPGMTTHDLSEAPVLLGHTNHDNETLEVIRFKRNVDYKLRVTSGDMYHLQLTNGMEDYGFGACSELIFAPINRGEPSDAALLSSGFRIYLLDSYTGTSSNEAFNSGNANHPTSMLIMAFQFPSETNLLVEVAALARAYIQHVISSVKDISAGVMPSGSNVEMNPTEANPAMGITSESFFAANLANLICQSYRSILGVDMLGVNYQATVSMLEQLTYHEYAILCFTFSSLPVCLFANDSGLIMLETTPDNLQTLLVDRVLDGSNNLSLSTVLPTIMRQGYAILPPGHCLSLMNRCVSYGQAVVWQVQPPDGSVHYLALAFIDWSFG